MKRFLLCLFISGTVITTFSAHGEKVSAEPNKTTTNIVIPHTQDHDLEEEILKRVNQQLQDAGEPPLEKREIDGNTIWIQTINED